MAAPLIRHIVDPDVEGVVWAPTDQTLSAWIRALVARRSLQLSAMRWGMLAGEGEVHSSVRWEGAIEVGTVAYFVPLPPHRWPFGPPSVHQPCCVLFLGYNGCDCAASDASDYSYGYSA